MGGTVGGLWVVRVRTRFNVPTPVGIGPERLKRQRSTSSGDRHGGYPGARRSSSFRKRWFGEAYFRGWKRCEGAGGTSGAGSSKDVASCEESCCGHSKLTPFLCSSGQPALAPVPPVDDQG